MDSLPIATTILSRISAFGVGMTLAYIRDVKEAVTKHNGMLFAHITRSDIHEAALARCDEQIKQVSQKADVAHTRIDKMREQGCVGHGQSSTS